MKREAVVNWLRLTNLTKVQSFLGMTGYYRRFVEGFSKIVLLITKLIQKSNKFEWSNGWERSV